MLGSTIRDAEGTSTMYVVIPNELWLCYPGAVSGDTVNLSNRESPCSPEHTVSAGRRFGF